MEFELIDIDSFLIFEVFSKIPEGWWYHQVTYPRIGTYTMCLRQALRMFLHMQNSAHRFQWALQVPLVLK